MYKESGQAEIPVRAPVTPDRPAERTVAQSWQAGIQLMPQLQELPGATASVDSSVLSSSASSNCMTPKGSM